MRNYVMVEGEAASVCITYDKTLEKSIAVKYSMADVMLFG